MADKIKQEGTVGVASNAWRRFWSSASLMFKSEGRGFILPLSILLSGVVFQRLAALAPWWTEQIYSRAFYPLLLTALSAFSRRFPLSVGEVLAGVTLTAAVTCVTILIVRFTGARGERRRLAFKWVRGAVWLASAILWSFLITFGLNYQRPLLFDLIGYEQRRPDADELRMVSQVIVESVNRAHTEARADGRPAPGAGEIVELLKESFDSSPELALLPRGDFAPPKPVFSSEVLTRLGISGIYSPYTGEPNYNSDIPDFQLPFSIAHEMAHQRGVARESEANFVAYVVCINARDSFVRYSGYRNGIGVLSELARVEPERARELARQLGPGYRADSLRGAQFWAKAAGRAGALSHRLNDLYLRANRVKSGAADYSNSTTLIIALHLRRMSTDRGHTAP